MSTAHFRKLGRCAARLGLIGGLALGSTALAASAAQAQPLRLIWNVNYHDFLSTSSHFTFVYTNPVRIPVHGDPGPIHDTEFQVTGNTCTTAVAPGGTCQVTVGYTADGRAIADQLQMHFTGPAGQPVAVPAVQLFAGGVTYVHTPHQNGAFVFPATAAPHRRADGVWPHLGQGGETTISYGSSAPNYAKVLDGPGPPIKWVKVVKNTCIRPHVICTVTLQAAPNTGAQRTANFQMSFKNAQTGVSVPVQDVTLIQPAG